jgi:hypothetical protein
MFFDGRQTESGVLGDMKGEWRTYAEPPVTSTLRFLRSYGIVVFGMDVATYFRSIRWAPIDLETKKFSRLETTTEDRLAYISGTEKKVKSWLS